MPAIAHASSSTGAAGGEIEIAKLGRACASLSPYLGYTICDRQLAGLEMKMGFAPRCNVAGWQLAGFTPAGNPSVSAMTVPPAVAFEL